jgi:murein DD-endopeptidase MepM/ murein hydrolase activator NlpD
MNLIRFYRLVPLLLAALSGAGLGAADARSAAAPVQTSLVRTVDLDLGETQSVTLSNGSTAVVKLLQVDVTREPVTRMLEDLTVSLEVNGERVTLRCGNYQLPVQAGGVQVDTTAVAPLTGDSNFDWWKLKKAARVRLWPANSPWIEPGTFLYPIKQRWFGSTTWFSNEPVSRRPGPNGKVYYHAGMDIGAAEGLAEVVAATDGVLVSVGTERAPGTPHPAAQPRYDVVYVVDGRGWAYRYSHLDVIDPALKPGGRVKMGQRLGYVGKHGSSGGWTHLHFHVESVQPSGEWGVQDSYAFLWQAYRAQYDPALIAVARPHRSTQVGGVVTLDASRSWAKQGVRSYKWTLSDGTTAEGPTVRRTYAKPGTYSEIVAVTDNAGNVDYDFALVRVYAGVRADGTASVVRVHAAYAPTFGIKPGDPVVFRSRGFEAGAGNDVFDFGDGTKPVPVPSNIDAAQHAANGYGAVIHHYRKPGTYIVKVERKDEATGHVAMQHLRVVVEE